MSSPSRISRQETVTRDFRKEQNAAYATEAKQWIEFFKQGASGINRSERHNLERLRVWAQMAFPGSESYSETKMEFKLGVAQFYKDHPDFVPKSRYTFYRARSISSSSPASAAAPETPPARPPTRSQTF